MNQPTDETIEHIATVTALPDMGSAVVIVSDSGECESCAAAKICKPAGGGSKTEMTVAVAPGLKLNVGDRAIIRGAEAIHRKAIMLSTVIPCLALIVTMIVVYFLTGSSGLAALCSFSAMILFFILLFLFRGKLAREFRFTAVGKANQTHSTCKSNNDKLKR